MRHKILVPFTRHQVDSLNRYQKLPAADALVCVGCHTKLVATPDGWTCETPGCKETQIRWAPAYMVDPILHDHLAARPFGLKQSYRRC